ncbi:hypothetical protein SO802_024879 [Lithocarpus litseifolius]|uniref:Uncharacterized protein n=1 Tax=Lithocarpus litseifolius TaxID=425828 RepID=A0AAW2CA42_9ROSI
MGGSFFFFIESKSFEFSVEEGGSFFLLRIFESSRAALRSVFMGKECAKRLLTMLEDHNYSEPPIHFARTVRDGEIVFNLQLGFNAHGSFLMISELLHGRQKGFIVVPEQKLGSGWRGFGSYLRKALAPGSLAINLPPKLFPASKYKPPNPSQLRWCKANNPKLTGKQRLREGRTMAAEVTEESI